MRSSRETVPRLQQLLPRPVKHLARPTKSRKPVGVAVGIRSGPAEPPIPTAVFRQGPRPRKVRRCPILQSRVRISRLMLPAQRKLADGQAAVREDVEHLTLGAPRAARHWLVRVG